MGNRHRSVGPFAGALVLCASSFWMAVPGLAAVSGPGCVSPDKDQIDCFARGANNRLMHKWYRPGKGWSDWVDRGGNLRSAPSVVSMNPGRLDVFARGTKNQLLQRTYNKGRWGGWSNRGGNIRSAPGCVSWGPNRIDCFARGANDQLVQKWYNGKWQPWWNGGGKLASAPSVTSWGPGRLDVFARGTNNQLLHTWHDNGRWGSWEDLKGNIRSAPGCVSWGPNRIDCFARGVNNVLVQMWYNGKWQPWANLRGNLTSAPSTASWAPGRLDIFAGRNDARMWHKWYDRGWSGWEDLGGNLYQTVQVVKPAPPPSEISVTSPPPTGQPYTFKVTGPSELMPSSGGAGTVALNMRVWNTGTQALQPGPNGQFFAGSCKVFGEDPDKQVGGGATPTLHREIEPGAYTQPIPILTYSDPVQYHLPTYTAKCQLYLHQKENGKMIRNLHTAIDTFQVKNELHGDLSQGPDVQMRLDVLRYYNQELRTDDDIIATVWLTTSVGVWVDDIPLTCTLKRGTEAVSTQSRTTGGPISKVVHMWPFNFGKVAAGQYEFDCRADLQDKDATNNARSKPFRVSDAM